MEHLAPIIKDLTIILSVAGVVILLFQRIRQPVVLGYLIAGIIVGPYTPPYALISDIPYIKILAELGVIFLMFFLGLNFSFMKLSRVGISAGITGTLEVIFMLAIGYATGRLLGWPVYASLFLGAALSISSTTIIIKALEELKLQKTRYAHMVFGILIIEDLLAILLLVALSTIVTTDEISTIAIAESAVKLMIVVGSWFVVGYIFVPYLFQRISNFTSSESLTVVSVALCLILVSISTYYHYSAALGAFVMGSILAETRQVDRINELILPIRDIFAAIFFVSVGMLINPTFILQEWFLVFILSAITILGKLITTSLSARLTGQTKNNSLRIGFAMAQVGEFSFIIIALGVSLGVTNNELYSLIVAVAAVTTFTTPYLIRLGEKLTH